MIKGIYETHIEVSNLEKALTFYTEVLGLHLAHLDSNRRIAFLFVNPDNKESMLGLWEQKENLQPRHFAFRCDKDFILDKAVDFLKQHKLSPYNFLKDGSEQPMVFAWMPALAIYFNDADGNSLEFIALLGEQAKPELGVLSYDAWLAAQ